METWYLIKTESWDQPTWRLKIERNGMDWFVNSAGGGMPINGTEEILDEKTVEDESDLDWSMTSYFHYKEDWDNGWLSPAGIWTQCDYRGHSDVAYYVLKTSEQDLEKNNYVKISGKYIFTTPTHRYTRKQIEWLKKHTHAKHAELLEETCTII